ncbi:MAG TPA: hypothetical protein VGH91_04595 [Gammaproteobacteria bacterium]|jgi:hypothetical protein
MNPMHEFERDVWLALGYAALFLCGIGLGFLGTIAYLILRAQLQIP